MCQNLRLKKLNLVLRTATIPTILDMAPRLASQLLARISTTYTAPPTDSMVDGVKDGTHQLPKFYSAPSDIYDCTTTWAPATTVHCSVPNHTVSFIYLYIYIWHYDLQHVTFWYLILFRLQHHLVENTGEGGPAIAHYARIEIPLCIWVDFFQTMFLLCQNETRHIYMQHIIQCLKS